MPTKAELTHELDAARRRIERVERDRDRARLELREALMRETEWTVPLAGAEAES